MEKFMIQAEAEYLSLIFIY